MKTSEQQFRGWQRRSVSCLNDPMKMKAPSRNKIGPLEFKELEGDLRQIIGRKYVKTGKVLGIQKPKE